MARKIGAIKSFLSLWMKHEKLYCSIFYEALQELKINEEQRENEDAISEALCPVLREVCFKHERDVKTPDWEKPNQPVNTDELKGGKIRKRPDFTCNFLNSLAASPETYEIPFHIECKRLGETVGSWNLNKNYVTKGPRKNNLTFSHLIFGPSSAAPQSQNPQNNQLFLRFCSIGPTKSNHKSEREECQLILSRALKQIGNYINYC